MTTNNTLRCAALVATLLAVSLDARAGETRIALDLALGHEVITDQDNDELSADQGSSALSATYFFGESGPFIGGAVGRQTVDNISFNGDDLGLPRIELDSRLLAVGYRTGATGEAQFLFVGARRFLEDEAGNRFDQTVLGIGVERDVDNWRLAVLGSLETEDDATSAGIDITGTYFPIPELGLRMGAGYSVGTVDLGAEDADSAEVHFGLGLELRL